MPIGVQYSTSQPLCLRPEFCACTCPRFYSCFFPPGEAQLVENVNMAFATKYHHDNPTARKPSAAVHCVPLGSAPNPCRQLVGSHSIFCFEWSEYLPGS